MRFSHNVLRAFVAVGRTGNFSKAALELGISQSAVSRHVALMEEQLNTRLFDRTTRQCALTTAGRNLFTEIEQALGQIDRAVRVAQNSQAVSTLNVSVAPFLSVEWFTPRLIDFIQANPGIDVKLTHSYDPPAFEEGKIDVGLSWSTRPKDKRLNAERLLSGELIPVCSPEFSAAYIDVAAPESLKACRLFHEFTEQDWIDWFGAAGVSSAGLKSQQISDSNALRQVALSGQGVSLLFKALIQDDIAENRLTAPFRQTIHSRSDYWLTYPADLARKPALRKFVLWLRREALQLNQPEMQSLPRPS